MLISPWAVQDGLGIDLVRFFFRLDVWVRFFDLLKLFLGSFCAASCPVLGHLGLIFGLLGADFWFVSAVLVSFLYLFIDVRLSLFDLWTFAVEFRFSIRRCFLRIPFGEHPLKRNDTGKISMAPSQG